jgi:hypothetical protein
MHEFNAVSGNIRSTDARRLHINPSMRWGMAKSSRKLTMPAYEICYMNDNGSLACTLAAMCKDDVHAKVLAHAMRISGSKRFEVWRDRKLVYERPLYFGAASVLSDEDVGVPVRRAAA